MAEGLKIQVGGDVTQANAALASLDNQIKITSIGVKGFGLTVSDLSQKVALFGGGVKTFSTSFRNIPQAATQAGRALQDYSKTSSSATQATINLSRVVQDAPYGFIGIANNLNPLLESFQRLRASTGSAGGAFKALGKSLTGVGGIGLALGIVSSALVLFGDKLFGASKASKAAREENEKLASSIAADLVKLTSLVGLVQNISASTDDRKRALAELNKEYGKYISLSDRDVISADNLVKSYKEIVDVLIRRAVVAGLQKEIETAVAETAGKILKIERDRIKAKEDAASAEEKEANNAKAREARQLRLIENRNKVVIDGSLAQINANREILISQEKFTEVDKIEKLKQELFETLKPLLGIANTYKEIGDLSLDPKVKPAILKVKPKLDFGYQGEGSFPPEEVQPIATEFGVMFSKELAEYFKNNPIDFTIDPAVKKFDQEKAIGKLFGVNFAADSPFTKIQREAIFAAQTINDILQPAFSGLFDAILKGEAPIKAFFNSLGQAVAQLMQKLISAAITAAILSAIFPGGLGGVKGFGQMFGKILGFASGGLVSGPQLALIGEGSGTSRSNPEVVAPLDRLRSMLSNLNTGGRQVVYVTGRLRGNDMLLQSSRTSRSQRRTTGR